MLKQSFARSGITGLLGACLLAGLSSLSGAACAGTTVAGWNVNGLVDGIDTVESPRTAGGDALVVMDKKSRYLAGQALQVFKSFDATGWRGKRVRMAYAYETVLTTDTQASDNVIAMLGVRVQCEKSSNTQSRNISKGRSYSVDAGLEFNVPKDANVCGFGFYLLKPAKVEVKSLKFSEVAGGPPPPVVTMEGRQLFPFPTPGTALPELEVSKQPVP
ncbi:MAG: hypothetical protein ABIT83_15590 [Massilia sp.]